MIRIFAGGKKHQKWVEEVCREYEKRLKKPFNIEWRFFDEDKLEKATEEIKNAIMILMDERGEIWDSPQFSKKIAGAFERGKDVVLVIGGAYGVSEAMRNGADFVWSLSKLVFPHQICRVIVSEQIYRAQEIYLGHPYHHE